MDIDLSAARSSLARTPATLEAFFEGLDASWQDGDEGPGTWTPVETVTHLLHVEPSWMDRLEHIHRHSASSPFPLVDRSDHMEAVGVRPVEWLLARFGAERARSLTRLAAVTFEPDRPGLHAELGPVTMGQLLGAWAVHDLNHLGQIVKTMAKQYRSAIGPWRRFLPIVDAP